MEKGFSFQAEGKKKRQTRLQKRAPKTLQLNRAVVDGDDAAADPLKPAVIPLLSPVFVCASPLAGSEGFQLPRLIDDKDGTRASPGVPASPARLREPPLPAIFRSRCVL
ncbi:hypothetical protein ACJRO7_011578 [Eucalyptus globulus]|uniref:Uncharacterized protein n=1 Tax=Eucalyptus globulus TaxID=34317 RepID=A0ABD3LFR6_EUCGL